MTKRELQRELWAFFREQKAKYTSHVCAEIDGKIMYLNECEVRFLQLKAMWAFKESKEAFDEFCKRHIVYSGATKRNSKHKMIFKTNGRFENSFENGFYNAAFLLTTPLFENDVKENEHEFDWSNL